HVRSGYLRTRRICQWAPTRSSRTAQVWPFAAPSSVSIHAPCGEREVLPTETEPSAATARPRDDRGCQSAVAPRRRPPTRRLTEVDRSGGRLLSSTPADERETKQGAIEMREAIRRESARAADALRRAMTVGVLAVGAAGLPVGAAAQHGGDGWTHPITPWGDPDLQGRWPIRHMTLTPLERPVELGTRAYLTDEEFAERAAAIEARNIRYEQETSSNQMGMGHWAEAGQVPQRQASLIVDPPNGRLPALTEAGRAKSATMGSSWQDIPFDTLEDFDSWDRCITRGLPA